MPTGRLKPTLPSAEAMQLVTRKTRLIEPFVRAGLRLHSPLSVTGAEHFPSSGPVLVLSNHVSLMDPVLLVLATGRPIHFMGTQSVMDDPVLGRIMAHLGGVPKKKFTADTRAVKMLAAWARLGAAVGLFPEGQRTWDGRPGPLVPGIAKLVRLMKAPVVTARIINVDHQWPRWVASARRGPIRVELDPPIEFARRAPLEQVRAQIAERILVDPDDCPRWPVTGKDLALGLANLLFACPVCFGLDALQERGDTLRCESCSAGWRVYTDHTLRGERGAPDTTVRSALDDVRAHYARSWCADERRLRAEGVVLESQEMRVLDVTRDKPRVLGAGRLRLTPQAFELRGPTRWRLPLRKVSVVSLDQRRCLQLFTEDRILELQMPTESVVKWDWFSQHWLALVKS